MNSPTQTGPYIDPTMPYVGFHPANMSYEQRIQFSMQLRQLAREFQRRQLRENFPSKIAATFAAVIALISITLIVLQIYLQRTGTSYNAYSGLWAGIVGFLYVFIVLCAGQSTKQNKFSNPTKSIQTSFHLSFSF